MKKRRMAVCALWASVTLLQTPVTASERTPAASVRLTPDQWACLGTRMGNLLQQQNDVVRVPLSPCGSASGTRGPGVGNVTAGGANATWSGKAPSAAIDGALTKAPLYLKKSDLTCIQRELPTLISSGAATTFDVKQCR